MATLIGVDDGLNESSVLRDREDSRMTRVFNRSWRCSWLLISSTVQVVRKTFHLDMAAPDTFSDFSRFGVPFLYSKRVLCSG